jgi:hypothetical protein
METPKKVMTAQDLARGCLLRLTNEPSRYHQQSWQTVARDLVDFGPGGRAEVSCQTTGCVAGTVSMMAGDRGLVHQDESPQRVNGVDVFSINQVIRPDGRIVDIRRRGQELLGLSDADASWLFNGDRKLPEVIFALTELAEGKAISKRSSSDMDVEERAKLSKYRVKPTVNRQHVTKKAPAKAVRKAVTVKRP